MESSVYNSYLQQILKYPLMSFEEEIEHSKLIQAGDSEAKIRLVQSNLRLVVSVAKKFINPYVSIMDLIQEGNIGLLTAATKYNYTYNTRFSTYAYAWIAQAITRFVRNKTGSIIIPHRKEELLRKIYSARIYLFQKLGREPSDQEIADKLSITLENLQSASLYSFSVVSIDMEVEEQGGQTLGETIPDFAFAPEQRMIDDYEKESVRNMLDILPDNEHCVIERRFNLNHDEKPKTLRQIGEELGVSAETVRQMEMRAIKKLRTTMNKREAI